MATRPAPLFGLLLALAACGGAGEQAPAPSVTPEPWPVDVPYLSQAFQDGAELNGGQGRATVRTQEVGTLALPSGAVVATDPFTAPDGQPLALPVPAGQYPVVLSLARYPDWPYEAIAAAMLRLAASPPSTWTLAYTSEQDPRTLGPGEVFGYPVDSGTGAFMSPEAARLFGQRLSLAGAVNTPYIKDLSAQMEANAPNGGAWVAVELDPGKGLNAILFASGYGDGFYSSYWGYDASGQLVCLVTDFGLLSP